MKLKKIFFAKITPLFDSASEELRDMLRYDMAFQSQSHPAIIAFPTFKTSAGDLGGNATVARWHSFGVEIDYFGDAGAAMRIMASEHPEQWLSYRHVPPNYKTLVPVTLAQALQLTDWRDFK